MTIEACFTVFIERAWSFQHRAGEDLSQNGKMIRASPTTEVLDTNAAARTPDSCDWALWVINFAVCES